MNQLIRRNYKTCLYELDQMEPMIPKAVNAFSEYHAVLSEEKEMSFRETGKSERKDHPRPERFLEIFG